jgi:hypothetical protein
MMKNKNLPKAWDSKLHSFLVFIQIVFYLVATSNYCLQIKSTLKGDDSTRIQPQKVFEL